MICLYIYIYIYILLILLFPSCPPPFSFCQAFLEKIIKLNPKVYDLISFLKNNLNTHCLMSGEEYLIFS